MVLFYHLPFSRLLSGVKIESEKDAFEVCDPLYQMTIVSLRPRLHCTGTTSAPEQKVLLFSSVCTAPVQKLYQIALPFTLYRSPLLIKSQYCYSALLKNKDAYHMSGRLDIRLFARSFLSVLPVLLSCFEL